MQGEVDFRQRLLLLDGADGIVKILRLVEAFLVVLHDGQDSAELRRQITGLSEGRSRRQRGASAEGSRDPGGWRRRGTGPRQLFAFGTGYNNKQIETLGDIGSQFGGVACLY